MTGPELLTRDEAARYLRVSVSTVDRLRAAGVLGECRIGGRVLLPAAELDRLTAAALTRRRRDSRHAEGVAVAGPMW